MFDMNMVKPLISKVFQGSGSNTLSKQAILSKLTQIPGAQQFLPFFQQIPEKNDYTENTLTQEMQNVSQKQSQGAAGSAAEKIKSKVGF